MKLTDSQVALITTCLRIGRDRFAWHTVQLDSVGVPGLVEQFKRQADDAKVLADMLDGADRVEVAQ